MTKKRKVDVDLTKPKKWQNEMEKLRRIILDCQPTEELKWGKPCYTFQKKNVVIIIALKEHCAVAFCKGALLKDANGILVKIGENTQAGRWIKFNSVREILEMGPILKSYIHEAIEAEKAGLEVVYKKTTEFKIPEKFQHKLDEIPSLKNSLHALTPGRQRGYLLYFSAPKQSKTRASRVERSMQQILNGKGLDDYISSGKEKISRKDGPRMDANRKREVTRSKRRTTDERRFTQIVPGS